MTPYYEHAGITIYHGDCRELLPSIRGDMAFADPPYGVGLEYAGRPDVPQEWTDFAVTLRAAATLAFVTPGIRNIWRWPAADWVLAWEKPGSTRRSDLGGFNEWEPVLMYGKRRLYHDAKRLPDCVNHAADTGDHPCPKPLRLLLWLISEASEPGAIVLDPFAGSGTTLKAAHELGRRAIGIEIEERYCEIAAQRLSQEVLNFAAPEDHRE